MSSIHIISKKAKIKQSSKTVFVTTMIASVIVAFSLSFMNALYGQWRFNERLHAEKELVRNQLEENVENARLLKQSFTTLENAGPIIPDQNNRPNSTVILDALPSRYDFPALITSMGVLADQSSVALDSFSGDDEEVDAIESSVNPDPQEVTYSVSVRGDYANILAFMTNVERSIRPITIERLSLSGSTTDMTATFAMITYYQPTVDLDITERTFR